MDTAPAVLYSAFDVVPSPKGASTHITYFARGLVNAGYRVQLITAGDPSLPERDTYCGAEMLRVPVGDDLNFLKRAVEFGQAVMRHIDGMGMPDGRIGMRPYDVAHFRSIWCGLPIVQARSRFGYKTLFEVNGLPSVELKYHYPALKGSPVLAKIKEQEIATLLLADAIICPSAVTRAFIAGLGTPREKITVIPNGVDTKLFTPQPINLPADQPTLLYIGTLADWQGLDVLIEAMPVILAQYPAKLLIVGHGRGRQRKDLAKRIRKLGLEAQVSIEPAVPHHEMPSIIAQADVCVAPLVYNDRNVTQGCCPLKVIEYMACARPIVAANLPVVRELVRDDVDALLFTPDDPTDLARCVLAILSDAALAPRLAGSAAKRARDRFSWHEAQKRLVKVYEKLVGDVKRDA
jgi:glycosyltransferase involved in cell wall biosynthesis